MTTTTITALDPGEAPTGTEVVATDQVQEGSIETVKLTINQILALITLSGLGGTTLTAVEAAINQVYIGEELWPQTAAEIAAGITPSNYAYQEGDIRRYGAVTTASDNSAAINAALLVSASGGAAAYIPSGTWKYAATLDATLSCSMYGDGALSALLPQGAINAITFTNQPTYQGARFFRDFSITGPSTSTSSNYAIYGAMTAASTDEVLGIVFENLNIQNFAAAMYGYGFWECTWANCFVYNCYSGFYFVEQSVMVRIRECFIIAGDIDGTGQSCAVYCGVLNGVRVQDLQVVHTHIFGYPYGVYFDNLLVGKIEHCDIDECTVAPVYLVTCNGGTVVRDNWLATNASTQTWGIYIADLDADNLDMIVVDGNQIECDQESADSIGIYVGGDQNGVVTNANNIGVAAGPFVTGIYNNTAGNHVAKFNHIYATGYNIYVVDGATECEYGPNILGNTTTTALVWTAAPSAGDTDATLASAWEGTTGSYLITFSTGELRYATLNNSSAAVSWSPALGLAATTAATAGLLPIWFTGNTPPGFSYYGCGSFTGALSGFATDVSAAVKWVANGKTVRLSWPAAGATGTSDATTMTMLGLPFWLWPISNQGFVAHVEDSAEGSLGVATINATTGLITFAKDANGSAFTATGVKGLYDSIATEYPYL